MKTIRLTLYALAAVSLCLVVAAVFLATIGLPGSWVQKHLHVPDALVVDIDRVRFGLPARVFCDGVHVRTGETPEPPWLAATRLVMDMAYQPAASGGRWGIADLHVKNGRWNGRVPGQDPLLPAVALTNINAHLEWSDRAFRVILLEGQSPFADVQVQGTAELEPSSARRRWTTGTLEKVLGSITSQVARAQALLRHVDVLDRPRVKLDFETFSDDAQRAECAILARGKRLRVHGFEVATWSVNGTWSDGALRMQHAQFSQNGSGLEVSGQFNPTSHMVEAKLNVRLEEQAWLDAIPPTWKERFSSAGVELFPGLQCEASLGPALWSNLPENVEARIQAERATFFSVPIETVEADLTRHAETLTVHRLEARCGDPSHPTPVRARLEMNLRTHAYDGHVEARGDPLAFRNTMPTNLVAVMDSVAFTEPPRMEFDFNGQGYRPEALVVRGKIEAQHVGRHHELVRQLQTELIYSNGVLALEDLHGWREEGYFAGGVTHYFTNRETQFNLEGTADPKAMADMMGSAASALIAPYRFEGSSRVHAKGFFRQATTNAYHVTCDLDGRRLGFGWFLADALSLRLEGTDQSLRVDDLDGSWCGGRVTGNLALDSASGTPDRWLAIHADMSQAELPRIMLLFNPDIDTNAYRGRVSGRVDLDGPPTDFLGAATVGTGTLEITDGYFLPTPLFGGLSRHLSMLYPGLGYAGRRQLSLTYRVADGRVYLDNLNLEGRFISIKGHGTCGFDRSVYLRVEAKLLSDSLPAEVLRLVTLPATKLLEFECTGTLDHPEWKAVNAPRKLLEFFQTRLKLPGAGG